MLAWLFNRLPTFGAIREANRNIFRYWDGTKTRAVDPIAVMIAMDNDPQYRGDVHPEKVDAGDVEATQITLAMVRRVFGVAEWTETQPGLTIVETLELLRTFCDYMGAVKKNTVGSPILPLPTEPTSVPSPIATTSGASVSG